MMNSGINKSATRRQESFGDWALETEFDWSEHRAEDRPRTIDNENKKYASRRAAAYWESQK